jgi:hypothetical protein
MCNCSRTHGQIPSPFITPFSLLVIQAGLDAHHQFTSPDLEPVILQSSQGKSRQLFTRLRHSVASFRCQFRNQSNPIYRLEEPHGCILFSLLAASNETRSQASEPSCRQQTGLIYQKRNLGCSLPGPPRYARLHRSRRALVAFCDKRPECLIVVGCRYGHTPRSACQRPNFP